MFIAHNCAFGATGTPTATMAGTSLVATSRVTLQISPPSTIQVRVVEWGISFNGSAAGVPASCELIQAAAAATMTTGHSTTTIQPIGDSTTTSRLTMGTSNTGFGSVATPASSVAEKYFDSQFVGPTSQYLKQWPLGREPVIAVSKFLQIRVTTAATLTAIAYIVFEEC